MSMDVTMPVITGEGEDGVVTAWFVDEGQACAEGQLIAEVQAEKTADEVRAPSAGYVVDRVGINDPVPQGRPICRIVDQVTPPGPAAGDGPGSAAGAPAPPPVAASPAAKRLARELGVDIASVSGTGPGGRITEADVHAASAGHAPAGMSPLRAVIARNMRRSQAETAPVTLFTTVELGSSAPANITAKVVRAAAQVLFDHPSLNGRRRDDVFTPSETAHVAVAIQTDEGLVAPVLRDPAAKSVDEVAEEIRQLAQRARDKTLVERRLRGRDLHGHQSGRYGVDGFTPIINLPQVAILGVGAIRKVPVVTADGTVAVGAQMTLSLTFDHAFVDGAPARSSSNSSPRT
jgi:pyruvate/2-oxoglutarate dehydrogenase complex dihydrolipoamide acyltransferase (E2) component